jgi:hypothetical protein
MRQGRRRVIGWWLRFSALSAATMGFHATAAAASPITYNDITLDPSSGLAWRRADSPALRAAWDAVKIKPFMSLPELNQTPIKRRGQPGVALIDYDNDGDLDVYVTNGPGRANSLFQNQLAQTHQATFVDVSTAAGVDATDQDSTGVCFGDIDNDGDEDLLVLGRMEPNRLFRNDGNGTFTNITTSANIGGGAAAHTSCTMGDVNNDGLLDIFVTNTFDWVRQDAIFTQYTAFNQHNQFYLNQGNNVFTDVTDAAGFKKLEGIPAGDATISWGAAFVDYDQDGVVDLMHCDDQAAMAPAAFAGINRGYVQTFHNDGTGHFTNVTAAVGIVGHQAQYMGISFGDLNSDGLMDFFATSVGDYLPPQFSFPIPPGIASSRWFLGQPGGGFKQLDAPPTSVFGWGTGMADYDNDGDTDIIYYGNLDVGPFISADNPGVIMNNDGNANFTWDRAATAQTGERVQRSEVMGTALGDLNGDGFVDIVHAAASYSATIPLVKYNEANPSAGFFNFPSPFNDVAYVMPLFFPIGPEEWEWAGVQAEEGILGVQISSGNENHWVKVKVKGSKGLANGGKVNRDGIGAVVKFTPDKGKPVLYPILGGSSHASEHALEQIFGLGSGTTGTVDILWPGGAHNRLYAAHAGESLVLPEIPCDYTKNYSGGKSAYTLCVTHALADLVAHNATDKATAGRLALSAGRAYDDAHAVGH